MIITWLIGLLLIQLTCSSLVGSEEEIHEKHRFNYEVISYILTGITSPFFENFLHSFSTKFRVFN